MPHARPPQKCLPPMIGMGRREPRKYLSSVGRDEDDPSKCLPPTIGTGRRQRGRPIPRQAAHYICDQGAPAKVSPSNNRDGVKGPRQMSPSKDRDGAKTQQSPANNLLQADGTKAPRHGAGLSVALGISTRLNARDGETNVRQHLASDNGLAQSPSRPSIGEGNAAYNGVRQFPIKVLLVQQRVLTEVICAALSQRRLLAPTHQVVSLLIDMFMLVVS
ncbi:hypothetical protein POSPLADRAFT_1141902 [Postia placenta MAD-698-R-SB12]|uniref:Uncharacterized protein n=1 Tax=Postia placenta MAD-698-R-SB12 TaxID=670580 RepID=A0A1X6N2V4_9APHY|nr:hypothetical protein POSPLADRAFT_1141902 [Postia placenta MAD-698-R-SB12]OSX62938.1 hypothetical protein POSPLADRAFT_1141902 [Postia placenta MAD-698-R-SB12]